METSGQRLAAVIFDFNGVIIDDEPLHHRAAAAVLAERGVDLPAEVYFGSCLGVSDLEILSRHLPDEGEAGLARLVRQKTEIYAGMLQEDYRLCPGAAALVRALAAELPLAIASGALREEIAPVLAREGMGGCFAAVVSAEDVEACKPDPAPYLEAARRLGLPASRCLVIEDAPGGITSAHAAGMRCVGVTTSAPAEALARADLVVPSLKELDLARLRSVAAASQG